MLDVMPYKALRLRVYHANQCIANADAQFNRDCTEHGKERGRKDTTLSEAINFNRQPTSANINYEFAMWKKLNSRGTFFASLGWAPLSFAQTSKNTSEPIKCSFSCAVFAVN